MYVNCNAGRVLRPLVIIKDGKTLLSTDILEKISQSQYDEVAFFPYLKSAMRPYWVSRCAKKDMSELNKCLGREEYSFSEFLNDYLKPGTRRTEKKTACLKLLDDKWDFAKANQCNR